MSETPHVRVGIGVIILNDKNEVLLGLRNASHGAGEWSFPGGHLEFGETIFDTAKREVKEETDLDVSECALVSVFDEMRYIESDNKHYLNVTVQAKYAGGEPKNMEPHKCDRWEWFSLDDLPENIFEPSEGAFANLRAGVIYSPGR